MNSKSFIFGKNYDSDYLSGRRLKRKSYGHRNDKNFRRRRKVGQRTDNRMEGPNQRERYYKKVVKTYDNRLTLNPKPIETSAETYRKGFGLFANGKTSTVVNNDRVLNDNKQMKARNSEDLFWILNKKSRTKRQITGVCSPATPQKKRLSPRHRPNQNENDIQLSQSVISINSNSSGDDIKSIRNEDKQRSYGSKLNQLNAKKPPKTRNKSPEKGFTKLKVYTKPNYNRSERIKSSQKTSTKVMPSLPTSLSIVQNLMNNYESERKQLSNTIPQFGTDLFDKRCDRIKQISKSFKQSIEQNLVQKHNYFKVKQSIDLNEKSPELTKHKSSEESVRPLSMVPYNSIEAQMVLKQFEPKVGTMLSRLLLNISEAFQTLSSKCMDKSFYE